jgi:hypothetical protein
MKRVADIVREYLVSIGADGLAGDECGCGLDDLMCCDGYCGDCEPAKKIKSDCEKCDPDGMMSCHGDGDGKSDCYVNIEKHNDHH